MATKAKRRKTLSVWNEFEDKLRKYLDEKNDADFMSALRALVATSKEMNLDDLKTLARKHHVDVSGENFERLNQMRERWNKLIEKMDVVNTKVDDKLVRIDGKSMSESEKNVKRRPLLVFKDAHEKWKALQAAAQLKELTIFRLKARNLSLVPDVSSMKKTDPRLNSEEWMDGKDKFLDGLALAEDKIKALDKLKERRPLSAGMIDICKMNPRLNLAQAEGVVKIFREIANTAHPKRSDQLAAFYKRIGARSGISDAQFNRAWESGQQYLQKVVKDFFSGKTVGDIRKAIKAAADGLSDANKEKKSSEYLKFQDAVEAMRRLDDKHLKDMLGDDGKTFRKEMEKKFLQIEKARDAEIKSATIDPSIERAVKDIRADIRRMHLDASHIWIGGLNKTKSLDAAGAALKKEIDDRFTDLTQLLNTANTNDDVKLLRKLHEETKQKFEEVSNVAGKIDLAVAAAVKPAAPVSSPKSTAGVAPAKATSSASPRVEATASELTASHVDKLDEYIDNKFNKLVVMMIELNVQEEDKQYEKMVELNDKWLKMPKTRENYKNLEDEIKQFEAVVEKRLAANVDEAKKVAAIPPVAAPTSVVDPAVAAAAQRRATAGRQVTGPARTLKGASTEKTEESIAAKEKSGDSFERHMEQLEKIRNDDWDGRDAYKLLGIEDPMNVTDAEIKAAFAEKQKEITIDKPFLEAAFEVLKSEEMREKYNDKIELHASVSMHHK